jgi:hypothetical protein
MTSGWCNSLLALDVDALADALLQRPPPDAGFPQTGVLQAGDLVAVGIGIIAALLR